MRKFIIMVLIVAIVAVAVVPTFADSYGFSPSISSGNSWTSGNSRSITKDYTAVCKNQSSYYTKDGTNYTCSIYTRLLSGSSYATTEILVPYGGEGSYHFNSGYGGAGTTVKIRIRNNYAYTLKAIGKLVV